MATASLRNSARIAGLLYLASIQYFIVQVIVAARFTPTFSWTQNTISDLGNTACAVFGTRVVCSPLHPLMNASFIVLGLTMVAGSHYAYRALSRSRFTLVGFTMFAIGGAGTIFVGLYPENTVSTLHAFGAALPFLIGNGGLVVLGSSLHVPRWLRIYTLVTGCVGLVALVLYMSHVYLGLGQGGMERIVAYPQTIWMILTGCYSITRSRHHR